MRKKSQLVPYTNFKALAENSKKFGDNHIIQRSRLGLIQLRLNGDWIATIEDITSSSLGKLRRKYLPLLRQTDKVSIEIHNCNSMDAYEFNVVTGVWDKNTTENGLF